ncbi:MAG TPA: hypothetical protein VLI93_18020 [Acetobacteraceae bacterium]|nr:hypothetical protein [Acetobacteraceae bacterium]
MALLLSCALLLAGAGYGVVALHSGEPAAKPGPHTIALVAQPAQVAVVDSGTLRLQDRVVRLLGVEPAARGEACRIADGGVDRLRLGRGFGAGRAGAGGTGHVRGAEPGFDGPPDGDLPDQRHRAEQRRDRGRLGPCGRRTARPAASGAAGPSGASRALGVQRKLVNRRCCCCTIR